MDSKFGTVGVCWRRGKRVDMVAVIDELQRAYEDDLDDAVCCCPTYGEVSEETYSSLICTIKIIDTMEKFGYLLENEANGMRKAATEKRLEVLSVLEVDNDER